MESKRFHHLSFTKYILTFFTQQNDCTPPNCVELSATDSAHIVVVDLSWVVYDLKERKGMKEMCVGGEGVCVCVWYEWVRCVWLMRA